MKTDGKLNTANFAAFNMFFDFVLIICYSH